MQMPQIPLNMLYFVTVTPKMECPGQKSVFQMESDQCGVWTKYLTALTAASDFAGL